MLFLPFGHVQEVLADDGRRHCLFLHTVLLVHHLVQLILGPVLNRFAILLIGTYFHVDLRLLNLELDGRIVRELDFRLLYVAYLKNTHRRIGIDVLLNFLD